MVTAVVSSCFDHKIDEDGDEVWELIKSGEGESLEVLHHLGTFVSDSMEGCILMPCFPGSVEFKEATRVKDSIFLSNEENLESTGAVPIVHALKETTEAIMASLSSSAKTTETKSKNRLSKSTLVSVKSILTLDGGSPIVEFSDEANDIFNGSSDSERVHSLETNLKRKGVRNTHLGLQQLKDICEGRLNWKSSQIPGGLSLLLVQIDPLDMRMRSADTLHVIDLKSRNKGFDDESIEKLTSTSIVLPKNSDELIENVDTLSKLLDILSEDCFVGRILEDLVLDLRRNQREIQSYCNNNEKGVVLILAALDRELKNFCEDVSVYPEQLENICRQLSFDKIVSDLKDGSFHFTDLPACIKNLEEHSETEERLNKKRKTGGNTQVMNEHRDPELILKNPSEYNTFYGNRKSGTPDDECLHKP